MNKTEIYLQVSLMGVLLFTPLAVFANQPTALVGVMVSMIIALVVVIRMRRNDQN